MNIPTNDTIAAIATAPGRGGIGIVRVSGPQTQDIARFLLGTAPEPRRAELRAFLDATGAAIATAPGRGGIGIVRVSGPQTQHIARALLGTAPEPRRAELRAFLDATGSAIDTGLALYFAGPHSFTGEDVLELHGHGGPVVMELLLQRVLVLGARAAAAGEFTQRAYLNDKLDLAQA